jgi:tetratricopeptide (TPR) repeat protein
VDLQRRIDAVGASTDEGRRLRLELARKYVQGGNYLPAYDLYRHLREQMPERADIAREMASLAPKALPIPEVLEMGEAHLRAGRFAGAIRSFLAVLQRDDSTARAWEGVGLALVGLKRMPEAVRYLSEATERDPNLARAQMALARAHLDGGFSEEARRRLERVTLADPKNALAWDLLSQALRQSPLTVPQAEEAMVKAVSLDPHNPSYLADLADLQAENNKPQAAEATYRAAMRLTRTPPPELKARLARGRAALAELLADRTPERNEVRHA